MWVLVKKFGQGGKRPDDTLGKVRKREKNKSLRSARRESSVGLGHERCWRAITLYTDTHVDRYIYLCVGNHPPVWRKIYTYVFVHHIPPPSFHQLLCPHSRHPTSSERFFFALLIRYVFLRLITLLVGNEKFMSVIFLLFGIKLVDIFFTD